MNPGVRPVDVVLGGLDADQVARAEQLIREDPAFRAEVERLRLAGVAIARAGSVGDVPDPPALRMDAALAARPAWDGVAAGEAAPPTAAAPLRQPRGVRAWATRPITLRRGVAALASAVLLTAGAGGAVVLTGDPAPGDEIVAGPGAAPVVLLRAFDGFAGAGRVSVRLPATAGRPAVLVADGLAPSPSGHYYELWLMSDGTRLASLGSFRVGAGGHVEVRFPVGVDPQAYRYLDISLEADDGDPAHSARSVLRSRPLS
ncbi:hypothetical protein DSM112329_01161 [Paraconexibacter sp. AEG42_29]|uniref:Anti-sigma K factor RskA C-terminal domain-containing protein n=1 Tax=Paraconexibacter sp. AEG42_29 TaxID=2997339 RepID=A0AAU7ASH4_9ACTN